MRAWQAVALGALTFCLSWGGWHLYIDHLTFHAVLEWANQQAQQQRPSPGPQP